MDTEQTNAPVKEENIVTEQPAWYDVVIDIFKQLLELSKFTYGTKKNF